MHIDDGVGIILVGDILQVAPGADAVSFMWSYPNMLPLPASAVIHIMRALQDVRFDRLYGAFEGQDIKSNVRQIVVRSVQKYLACLRKE